MTIELNTLAPKKWVANYSGSAPVIDITDGVLVGDFAIDSSNDAIWRCTDNTDTAAVWVDTAAGGSGGTVQGTDGTYDIQPTNEGVTAGNARGENSVDLCTVRSDAAYVCAGINSGSLAGENNGGTGTHTAYLAGKNNHTNTGNSSSISGAYNYSNSGNYCSISGAYNHANTGHYCNISGAGNYNNTGNYCNISGYGNGGNTGAVSSNTGYFCGNNSGDYSSISGYYNSNNSGSYTSISGRYNNNNSSNYSSISGFGNQGNFGAHSIIGGGVTASSTKIATSGTSATASTDVINKTSHGVVNLSAIKFTTLTGGTGLSTATQYYARDITANTFKVALTRGGAAVDITVDYTVANYIANAVNYGNYNIIAGQDNEGGTGNWCSISGYQNYNNTGDYCSISGQNNYNNSGSHCSISGGGYYGNGHYGNTGTHCSISGYSNSGNTGNYNSISGGSNHTNTGTYNSISGGFNHSNAGTHCSISGANNYNNSGSFSSISGWNSGGNSGNYCSISGGTNNSNSGNYCSISGGNNINNSGNYCNISGYNNNTNSGTYCSISGYDHHTNTGNYCSISGGYAPNNNLDYARVHGGGSNARVIDLVAKASTTNTTPKAITLGGVVEGAAGSIIIPADTAWAFTVHVVAVDVTGSFANSKKFSFDGLVLNDAGTVTVSSATLGTDATQGTFTGSVALSADTTNDALRIMATGIGTDTIRWTARVELTQVN